MKMGSATATLLGWMPPAKSRNGGDPAKCPGTKRSGPDKGKPCEHEAGWGTPHTGIGYCRYHGGNSPSHLMNAEKIKAGMAAREAVNELDLAHDIDPMDALVEELARTNGAVAWLGMKVSTLEESKELGNGKMVSELVGPTGGASGGYPEYKPSVWYVMWTEERAHLARVAKLCLDAGIDKRRIEIAEQQGQLLAKVVNVILGKLGIDIESPKTRAAVRAGFTEVLPVAGRELEAVAS